MEPKDFISSWQKIHTIVDEAMEKKDRSVSIYISPDGGMSVAIAPWPDEETLREAYEKGNISYNDYRRSVGLSPVKDTDDLISRSALLKEIGDPGDGMVWPTKEGFIALVRNAPAVK